ncbi:unnamed protein product, partial [Rotaria magnacalcarata]
MTVAGGHRRGNATNQLNEPRSLFVDENQTMFIADSRNHRIVRWKLNDTNGEVVLGGLGQGNRLDQLSWPSDMLIDKETNSLIICDQGNRRVLQWSLSGNATTVKILLRKIFCFGIALDDQRYLYISDSAKHAVLRYKIGKPKVNVVAGGNGEGSATNQLNWPTYLFVDREQSVYVSDFRNHRVMKWKKDAKEGIVAAGGQGKGIAMTQLSNPRELFVDRLGTIFVAADGSHRVMRWPEEATQGTVIVGTSHRGRKANQLACPWAFSFDQHGNIYVLDHNNYRVQRFSLSDPADVSLPPMNITSIPSSTTIVAIPTTTAPPANDTSAVRISNYSGVLTTSSSTFTRNGRSGTFYFEAIEVIPKQTGSYTFKSYSAIDSYGYLYTNPFDPLNTTSNLLTHADDNENETSDQFSLECALQTGTSYTLIFTTFDDDVTGPFSVAAVGPVRVSLVRNNVPTTEAPYG